MTASPDGRSSAGEPAVGLHSVLRARWSPKAYEPGRILTDTERGLLLEAARWAPSSNNEQPWRFVVADRGSEVHDRVSSSLVGSAREWAPRSSALIVSLCTKPADDNDATPDYAVYDVGQAVAHLTFQATSLGLAMRQIASFDAARLVELLDVPRGWRPLTVAAIGRARDGIRPRCRRHVAEVEWEPRPLG